MRRACSKAATPLFAFTVLFAFALPAQERDPGWEIFAPTEEPREKELTLDPEDDPGVQKPKYSLEELSNPTSYDPDVYIRYSPGTGERDGETERRPLRVEPPPAETRMKSRPGPGEESLPVTNDQGTVSPITAERLTNLEAPIPVVNTRAEYRQAVANQEPEILFEGKRWVFSEETGSYVDPRAAALAEARRVQEAIRLNAAAPPAVIPATGIYPSTVPPGSWPGVQPVPETVQPRSLPLSENVDEAPPAEQYRVPGVISGRENGEEEESRSRRRGLRKSPVYGGSR